MTYNRAHLAIPRQRGGETRDCVRCSLTFPLDRFDLYGHGRRHVCPDCAVYDDACEVLGAAATKVALTEKAVSALWHMGYWKAACAVLADYWPDIQEARAMQHDQWP